MSEPPAIPSDTNAQGLPAPFLDVPYLLDASQPRARGSWFGPGIATLIVREFAPGTPVLATLVLVRARDSADHVRLAQGAGAEIVATG